MTGCLRLITIQYMRRILLSLCFILAAATPKFPLPTDTKELRLMTYNIRFANPADTPHTWEARKSLIIRQVLNFAPDIAGFQEALHMQVSDLEMALRGYMRVGVGRDDGSTAGEYSPIFFTQSRFDLLDHGTLWLSETPDSPSKGWDAALPRIATWAMLRERGSGQKYLAVNTHFDHVGQLARLMSVHLLMRFFGQDRFGDCRPLLMGDFNMAPTSEPYIWLSGYPALADAFTRAEHHLGPAGTFNGIRFGQQGDRIDYIFVAQGMRVSRYETLAESVGGILPSDHWPVMVILIP